MTDADRLVQAAAKATHNWYYGRAATVAVLREAVRLRLEIADLDAIVTILEGHVQP